MRLLDGIYAARPQAGFGRGCQPRAPARGKPSMSRLRLGMIGGGTGAFIGSVHRSAAAMDGHWELVAGCFSRDPDTSYRPVPIWAWP